MDNKHHRMDGKAIRRARETGSRSGAMEDHDSQPSSGRRHPTMMMMMSVALTTRILFCWLHVVSGSLGSYIRNILVRNAATMASDCLM